MAARTLKKLRTLKDKLPTKWYVSDFETIVEEDTEIQEKTDVWAAATVDLDAPDEVESVEIFHTISTYMWDLCEKARDRNIQVKFHNLKFDGSFILNFLKKSKYWKEDSYELNQGGVNLGSVFHEYETWKMPNGSYRYNISSKGQWYSIVLKTHGHLITISDSLKLLPFSVRDLGKGFKTKHQKLEMEYVGHRWPGCPITQKEKEYIANDVLVVKEALNIIYKRGLNGLTIGACCLDEFKKGFTKTEYQELFPNVFEMTNPNIKEKNIGEWIRKTYKGGWCYVVPEKAGKEFYHGTTCDVNSLYPSQMHSESGNRFCIGLPTYFVGEPPKEAKINERYYFLHVKTRFYIKPGMLPTVQIKGNLWYPSREWLLSSDIVDMRLPKNERYKYENRKRWKIEAGQVVPALADLYLTQTDWEMLQKHYTLEDTQFIDGFWFETKIGLFDNYINKWRDLKINAKTPQERLISKMMLNNLYGKTAASPESDYRIEFLNEDEELRGYVIPGYDKTPGFIAIGSQITSFARRFTVSAAQANNHGPDKPGFIYADTDSIHCDLSPDEIVGAPKHPTAFNHWKYETCWDYGKFIRAKTYVEHVTHENEEPTTPYYNVKCAGMSDHVKELFLHSVTHTQISPVEYAKLGRDEQLFISEHRTFDDFKVGLEIPGMLKAKNIKGGTLLVKGNYKMRDKIGD